MARHDTIRVHLERPLQAIWMRFGALSLPHLVLGKTLVQRHSGFPVDWEREPQFEAIGFADPVSPHAKCDGRNYHSRLSLLRSSVPPL